MTIWLIYHCSKTTFICLSASHLFVLTADFAQPYWTGTTEALNATLSAHVLWGWNTNRPQEAAQVSTHSDGIRFHHCWKTAHRLNISSGINKQSIDLCGRRHKKQAYAFRVIRFAPADWLASLLNAHVAQSWAGHNKDKCISLIHYCLVIFGQSLLEDVLGVH